MVDLHIRYENIKIHYVLEFQKNNFSWNAI